MAYLSLLALSCWFLTVSSSQQHAHAPAEPIPPSLDPFYTAPPNFESASPGTILRSRSAPGNFTGIVANSSAAYNILFRTTDARYRPSWAVTTLVIPSSNITQGGNSSSLLSIQFAYNSNWLDASPSYSLYGSFSQPLNGIPAGTGDISEALGNGWYVNTPDFEGPLASFGLGIQAGHAVLDSIRAVLSSGLVPSKSTKYAMWGYSGGSIASEWASELQEQYAPELSFSGMAIGGLVPNITGAMDNITASPYAGLLPEMLLGATSQFPDAREYLVSRLHQSGPYNASYFLNASNLDISTAFVAYAGQDISKYFIGGQEDLNAPILRNIFNRNGFQGYHGVPRMPTFVYKAIHDQFNTVNDTDTLVERYCGVGADIWYQRNEVGGHIAEIVNGRGRALSWLKSVFESKYEKPKDGCTVENVVVNITSSPL